MAGLMAAAMTIIELALMFGMYANKRRNLLIITLGVVALLLFWMLIRRQAAITDNQFLRSMIPQHAGAILMCERGCGSGLGDRAPVSGDRFGPAAGHRTDEGEAAGSRRLSEQLRIYRIPCKQLRLDAVEKLFRYPSEPWPGRGL
jgi:hypothetical protein